MTTATRRLRRVGIAGLATIATVGGLVATTAGVANAAFATTGGVYTYQASTVAAGTAPDTAVNGATVDPTLLYPGKTTAQAGASLGFSLPNTFSGGDQLTFTIQNNGKIANTAQNCSAANNVVGLAAAPTVTLGVNPNLTTTANPSTLANGTTAGSTTDTAPTFTVALGTSSSCVAQAGVHDEFTVTFTDHSTGTAADFYNFQITGLTYTVTAQATPGQVSLDVLAGSANTGGGAFALSGVYANVDAGSGSTTYPPTNAGVLPRTPTANSAIIDAYVSPLQFAIAAPDTIQPDGTKQTIGNITLTETLPGQFNSGAETPDNYVLTFAAGVTVDTLSPAPTVTIAGNLASTEAVTLGAVTANSVAFSVVGGTTTSGPATVTISGVRLSSTSATAVAATLNGGILNANGDPTAIYTAAASRTAPPGEYPLPLAPVGLPATISVNSASFQIGGTDRYATAAKLFQGTVGTCSELAGANRNAVLVDGTNYPDALSANYLAGALRTGILLTDPSFLPGDTLGALRTEGITTVYVVGGTSAVSAGIVAELAATPQYNCDGTVVNSGATAAKLNVVRIAGADRYATGQLVDQFTADLSSATSRFSSASDDLSYTFGTPSLHTAFVASGTNYPDALAAGPAVYQGYPLVLTDPGTLTASSAATLTNLGIQQVIILGGTDAVSASVATQLAALNSIGTTNVIRFAGTDRTDTSRLVAEFELTLRPASSAGTGGLGDGDILSGEYPGVGFPSNYLVNGALAAHGITVYLANGSNYPDALAGGPLAGVTGSPLVLAATSTEAGTGAPAFVTFVATLDGATNTALTGNVEDVTALGLSSAVSPSVLATVATAASGS